MTMHLDVSMKIQSSAPDAANHLADQNQTNQPPTPPLDPLFNHPPRPTIIDHGDGSQSLVATNANGRITHTALTGPDGQNRGEASFSPTTGQWQKITYRNGDGSSTELTNNGNGSFTTSARTQMGTPAPAAGGITPSFANSTPTINVKP
ncbi:hypothetical protein G3N95_40075 [Paraburkholderia sp. Tr-20389]|uniref:hypothetical protein n=1 Tax=Paraburkholderia sp. Tr-20389 TaxID=2703903 RepID=UPI00197D75B1|nr:hypothetical protein [Paraburkholderia sp. Tr-20389]MBN3759162.1 hypothetical protein [Paraburkholderia sp. Tr-20389]